MFSFLPTLRIGDAGHWASKSARPSRAMIHRLQLMLALLSAPMLRFCHLRWVDHIRRHATLYLMALREHLCCEVRAAKERPADMVGAAVMVARISVGDLDETPQTPSGRVRSGRAGGAARAGKLAAEKRREIAKKAAGARWR
jgi:hypothetical protein